MSAIVPENENYVPQPQEAFDFAALIVDMIDTSAGIIRALRAAREARQVRDEACYQLGELLGYLNSPVSDPEVTARVVKVLSLLEGVPA